MTDDDSGHARKCKASYIIWTLFCSRFAFQMNLIPDGRHLDTQMRVVREKRKPCGCARASHCPGVGSDSVSDRTQREVQERSVTAQYGEGFIRDVSCQRLSRGVGRTPSPDFVDDHWMVLRIRWK